MGGGGRGFGPPGGFGPGARGVGPGAGGRGADAPFLPPGGGGFARFGGRGGGDVLHQQVGDDWPLIQRLLSDEMYAARYRSALERALDGLLAPDAFERRARALHTLIASAVLAERPTHTTISSADAFKTALDGLIASLKTRQDEVRAALALARPR
jgi:hypothetical protein